MGGIQKGSSSEIIEGLSVLLVIRSDRRIGHSSFLFLVILALPPSSQFVAVFLAVLCHPIVQLPILKAGHLSRR